jgi:hypothetical protein
MNLNVLPMVQRLLWGKLAGVEQIAEFYLAGGTAAALHLQHRESLDFDFFTRREEIPKELAHKLKQIGSLEIQQEDAKTFLGLLDDVKFSFFVYPYPPLSAPERLEGIKVAALQDIAAMKIIAAGQRGTKKDFIDLHALFGAGWNLEAIFDAVERKYRDARYNKLHLLKSLTYFDDAEADPMPKMLAPADWTQIKSDLEAEVRRFLLGAGA